MDRDRFLVHARVEAQVLQAWIEAGWVAPQREDEAFVDVDLARAQLICELTQDLGVNDEAVSIILSLIDQIHGLRCALRDVLTAVHAQPETMRRQIIDSLPRPRRSGAEREDQGSASD